VSSRRVPVIFRAPLVAVLLVVSTAGTGLGADAPAVSPEVATRLQARLDRWREARLAPGVAAAVRSPDGSLWIGTSGVAAVGKAGRTVKLGTPFAIASLTKTFMAALILRLVEQGHLSLKDPISRWLPRYPDGDRITVRMLLNHRSGIFNYFEHPQYERKVFGRPRHHWTVQQILALRGPAYCAPGACYHYSNTNYVLLGRIVERITGKSAAKLIRNRFLKPLGLGDTFFQGQERIGKWTAKGYWVVTGGYKGWADGTPFRTNTSAATVANAAGAMVSSVRDVTAWQAALLRGDVLAPESLAEMLRFHPRSGYGLGMRVAWLDGKRGVGHGGSLRGYVAIMYRLPDPGIDVVVLTNRGNVSVQSLADALARVALNNLPPPPPPPDPA
jgi:D-alanyl-D-alanine carboxypeptidase